MPEGRNVPKSSIYKFKHWKKIQHEKNQFVFKCYKQKNFITKTKKLKIHYCTCQKAKLSIAPDKYYECT